MPKSGLLSSIAGLIAFVPIRIHTYTGQVWSTKTGNSRKFFKLIDKVAFIKKGKPIEFLGKGSLTGVNLNQYDINIVKDRNVIRKELGFTENDFVYGFFARKSISKGIKELFDSFAKVAHLPNTKLLMIGPDETEGCLDELNVKYASIIDKIVSLDKVDEHEKYLAVCDVLCSPSSSEGFGSIVIEAAALGIPTIGFKVLGLTDSVDHDNSGILVPFKDITQFSNAMISLYSDKEKLEKMKLNAKERVVKYFSADDLYRLQFEFYKSLM